MGFSCVAAVKHASHLPFFKKTLAEFIETNVHY